MDRQIAQNPTDAGGRYGETPAARSDEDEASFALEVMLGGQ